MNIDKWILGTAFLCYLAILSMCLGSTWPTWRQDLEGVLANQGLAAWMQAIGSVLAIAAAIWVSKRQHEVDLEREHRAAIDAEVSQCNRVMLVLSLQYGYLMDVRKQVLGPHANSPGRHMEVQPDVRHDKADRLNLDAPGLAFLSTRGALQLPLELARAENYFRLVVSVLNARSIVHREQFQVKLDAAGVSNPGGMTLAAVESVVGPQIVGSLRTLTDELYDIVETAFAIYDNVMLDAPKKMKALYPDHEFLKPQPA